MRVNGNGNQSRGFTYIDDIARGTMLALKPLGYEIVNIGGHEVIIDDWIKLIEELTGKKANVGSGAPNLADMFTNWADVGKAKKLLGWALQSGFREGVKKLIDWYVAERSWASGILTP